MEVAAKLAAKPLMLVVSIAAAKLSEKLLKEEWAAKFQPQLEKLDAGINALRTKELKAAQIHFDLARIRLGHDLNDDSARNELENAKKEAVKAIGIVSKFKEKLEVIELILTVEILLFLNAETSSDPRLFLSTRDQCLYFLRKLKELSQVSQFFDIELKGAFSKGTFHSDRMWLLLEVFRMDVDVHAFFLSHMKRRMVAGDPSSAVEFDVTAGGDDRDGESFQNSIQVLYVKTKDEKLYQLLYRQLNDHVDGFCLTLDSNLWTMAKNLSSILLVDVEEFSNDRIRSLMSEKVKQFEASKRVASLEKLASLLEITRVPSTNEVSNILVRTMEEETRAFLNAGDDDDDERLYVAERIATLFHLTLPETSEVIPQLLSFWSNQFRLYDEEGVSSWMSRIPSILAIHGSLDILDVREEVGTFRDAENMSEGESVDSSSVLHEQYESENVFSPVKNAKWMSEERASRPFHEWIGRKFRNPVKIVVVALQATPHAQTAPTMLSVEGRNDDDDWITLMDTITEKWKSNQWKSFVVSSPGYFKQYRFNFFENTSSNVVAVFKIKLFV